MVAHCFSHSTLLSSKISCSPTKASCSECLHSPPKALHTGSRCRVETAGLRHMHTETCAHAQTGCTRHAVTAAGLGAVYSSCC